METQDTALECVEHHVQRAGRVRLERHAGKARPRQPPDQCSRGALQHDDGAVASPARHRDGHPGASGTGEGEREPERLRRGSGQVVSRCGAWRRG